jgi:hypothetical protein
MKPVWHVAEAVSLVVRVAEVICLAERYVVCVGNGSFYTVTSFRLFNHLKKKEVIARKSCLSVYSLCSLLIDCIKMGRAIICLTTSTGGPRHSSGG